MAADSEPLISFDVIETHKENIQSLPSGRSARALASIYSPLPPSSSGSATAAPTPSDTQNLNDAIRQEYERELLTLDESDDPLDVYDRYVRWTLDAYPSAQATAQSQLLPLLERATKAFLASPHYKNDPRYLRLWLHYIRLFADAPREVFAFLARHGVGDGLALFYEEFAAWLEAHARWAQADEVYRLGIDRNARPAERLLRKFAEFQHRVDARPHDGDGPSSPALPTVRPALAAKIDPFASAPAAATGSPADPQERDRAAPARGGAGARPGKQKMAIFADTDNPDKPGSSGSTKGWESIGSLAERRKENVVEAKPWTGETLQGGKRNAGVPKMMIFKDETRSDTAIKTHPSQQTVNSKTGRVESVFVNLEAVYPNPEDPSAEEYCFEELRARHRGWLDHDWAAERQARLQKSRDEVESHIVPFTDGAAETRDIAEGISKSFQETLVINDENAPPSQKDIDTAIRAKKIRKEERANRTRKIRIMEVKGETQTVQTNLDSPTRPKLRKKKTAEPTMTVCTREAMDEIYGIFNQPLKSTTEEAEEDESEESEDEDEYTSAGESTGTGRISGTTSEYGDETTAADFTEGKTIIGDDSTDTNTDTKSVGAWSDFSTSKHVPRGDVSLHEDESLSKAISPVAEHNELPHQDDKGFSELATPTSPDCQDSTGAGLFLPPPPEDFDVPTHPFRDAAQVAHNRLPFMTPIVEKTESSVGAATARAEKDYFNAKTPCRQNGAKTPTILELDDETALDSPFREILKEALKAEKENQPSVPPPIGNKTSRVPLGELGESKPPAGLHKKTGSAEMISKGPIIQDAQCNPVDETVRATILSQIRPPLSSYDGYYENKDVVCGRSAEIRKFTKALAKMGKSGNDRTASSLVVPPTLRFEKGEREYVLRRELGKGAFAPVYLVESNPTDAANGDEGPSKPAQMGRGEFGIKRNGLEAIKMEEPPSAWEFYIIRQAKRRLGVSRAVDSVIHAYEMRLFRDECFLVEEYREQGTLLNLINLARADGPAGGVMDEALAMFFTVELLRTVEALHAKGLLHGDLKADNVLVRLDPTPSEPAGWSSQYHRDGRHGWAAKGIALIDFGRGIDLRAFRPDAQFVADWPTTAADCAEMREMRPWTHQVDYHGLAGVVHSLLFGRYMETVAERGGALGAGGATTRTYRIRESLKRYWQTDLWAAVLDLLLNPLAHLEREEGGRLPVLRGMRECRERMEDWLEANCERGVGLKGLIRRMEVAVKDRRR